MDRTDSTTVFVFIQALEGAEAQPVQEKAFYSDSNEDSDSGSEGGPSKPSYVMDPDHRLLLRNAKPLLNSRNSAVVMAVVQLYYHCAPKVSCVCILFSQNVTFR